jgi:hypothetical protein
MSDVIHSYKKVSKELHDKRLPCCVFPDIKRFLLNIMLWREMYEFSFKKIDRANNTYKKLYPEDDISEIIKELKEMLMVKEEACE